jgi:hypothetical protein
MLTPAVGLGSDRQGQLVERDRQPSVHRLLHRKLQTQRVQFETLLLQIAEWAEEWLTSAQAMGLARRTTTDRVLPWERPPARPGAPPLVAASRSG